MALSKNAIVSVKNSMINAQQYKAELIRKYLFIQSITEPEYYGLEFSGFSRMRLKIFKVLYYINRLIIIICLNYIIDQIMHIIQMYFTHFHQYVLGKMVYFNYYRY